jgi:molecular chaperone DnaK
MKQEAEQHAAEDRKRKEVVDIRNQADTLLGVSEKTLKDAGDKVKPEDKTAVEAAMQELKDVKDKEDLEVIRTKMQALSDAIQKVGAAMYQQDQAQQPGTGEQAANTDASSSSTSDQGPVDAEYKEVPKE